MVLLDKTERGEVEMTKKRNKMDANRIIKKVVERIKGVDEFEVYLSREKKTTIEVKNKRVDSFEGADTWGICCRLLKDKALGFSYATSEEFIPKMVEDALQSMKNSTQDPSYGFPEGYHLKPLPFKTLDPELSLIPISEKIKKAKDLEEAAFSYDPRIKKVRKSSYNETISEIWILNSQGIHLSTSQSLVQAYILVVAEEGKEAQVGFEFGFDHFFSGLDTKKLGIKAAERAVGQLGARVVPSGKLPLFLENVVAAEFLEVLSASFLAESIKKNKSLLSGRLGEGVFSPLISIIDDGLLPQGMRSVPFDGEGVPTQRTPLVEKGVLKGFLYDNYYAHKDGISSTGNSLRSSLKSPPKVGISNLFIEKGKLSLADLFENAEGGLYITEVMGIHTADPISGDFSVGAAGFRIEAGRPKYPVKGVAFSGNIITLFSQVNGVGSDLRLFGQVGSPSLGVLPMDISGK